MANILQQVVTATALAAGATIGITHGIGFAGVAKIPDRVFRDNDVFTIVSCTSTTLTVRNEGTVAATGNFLLQYDHTYLREFGDNATQQLTPAPFIPGGAAGTPPATSSASSLVLQFQPGGAETGPIVFNSFSDLYAELVAQRTANGGGKYAIGYDSTLGAVTVPAGTYDLTNVDQIGLGDAPVAVSYADGTVFTGARRWKDLIITNLNTVTAPHTDVANGDVLVFDNTVVQTQTGGVIGMFAFALTAGQNATLWFTEGSTLGGSETGTVLSIGNGAGQTRIKLDALSSIAVPTAITNNGFGTPVLVITAPDMIQVPNIANWTGSGSTSPGPTFTGPASLLPIPYLSAAQGAAVTATHGAWLRLTSGGGTFTQPLPAINGVAAAAPGVLLLATDPADGGNPIPLVPPGTDTIQGSANPQFIPNGGALLLASNGRGSGGVGDWSIVAMFGSDRVVSPVIWGVDNIPAASALAVLPAKNSLFNTWQTARGGSITGMAVRLSAQVTQGSITVVVTVGGIDGTLTATISAGQQGANLTQRAGSADNFTAAVAAGVGFRYSSTADLLPAGTLDMEVTMEAALTSLAT